eukprot:Nk52_evm19s224 gene=Nk52_evmTU19s224
MSLSVDLETNTNIFALAYLNGIKWKKYKSRAHSTLLPGFGKEGAVFSAYSQLLDAGFPCFWQPSDIISDESEYLHSFHDEAVFNLWVFSIQRSPSAENCPSLLDLEEIDSGTCTDNESSSSLKFLFKAIYNVIERTMATKNFVRLGNTFLNANCFLSKSPVFSTSVNLILYGSVICCSTHIHEQYVRPVNDRDTSIASLNLREKKISALPKVYLAPYGLPAFLVGGKGQMSSQYCERLKRLWELFYPFPGGGNSTYKRGCSAYFVQVVCDGVKIHYPAHAIFTVCEDVQGKVTHNPAVPISQLQKAQMSDEFLAAAWKECVLEGRPSAKGGGDFWGYTDIFSKKKRGVEFLKRAKEDSLSESLASTPFTNTSSSSVPMKRKVTSEQSSPTKKRPINDLAIPIDGLEEEMLTDVTVEDFDLFFKKEGMPGSNKVDVIDIDPQIIESDDPEIIGEFPSVATLNKEKGGEGKTGIADHDFGGPGSADSVASSKTGDGPHKRTSATSLGVIEEVDEIISAKKADKENDSSCRAMHHGQGEKEGACEGEKEWDIDDYFKCKNKAMNNWIPKSNYSPVGGIGDDYKPRHTYQPISVNLVENQKKTLLREKENVITLTPKGHAVICVEGKPGETKAHMLRRASSPVDSSSSGSSDEDSEFEELTIYDDLVENQVYEGPLLRKGTGNASVPNFIKTDCLYLNLMLSLSSNAFGGVQRDSSMMSTNDRSRGWLDTSLERLDSGAAVSRPFTDLGWCKADSCCEDESCCDCTEFDIYLKAIRDEAIASVFTWGTLEQDFTFLCAQQNFLESSIGFCRGWKAEERQGEQYLMDDVRKISLISSLQSVEGSTGLEKLYEILKEHRKFSHRDSFASFDAYSDVSLIHINRFQPVLRELFGQMCEGTLRIKQFLDSELPSTERSRKKTLQKLPTPMINVGYEDGWLSVSPMALPFWEKLVLEPYSSVKNIFYCAVCPSNPVLLDSCETFFKELSCIYQTCRLGKHQTIAHAEVAEELKLLKNGILSVDDVQTEDAGVKFENEYTEKLKYRWKDNPHLSSFFKACLVISRLLSKVPESNKKIDELDDLDTFEMSNHMELLVTQTTYVVYLVNGFTHHTSVYDLMCCFSALATLTPSHVQDRLIVQVVDAQTIISPGTSNSIGGSTFTLKTLAFIVYSKCRQIIHPRSKFIPNVSSDLEKSIAYKLYGPAFVISQECKFADLASLPVLDECKIKTPVIIPTQNVYVDNVLHCCYKVSPQRKWMVAVITDSHGELMESRLFYLKSSMSTFTEGEQTEDENFANNFLSGNKNDCSFEGIVKMWSWCVEIVSSTALPWRVVIGRMGDMTRLELNYWHLVINSNKIAAINSTIRSKCSACSLGTINEYPSIQTVSLVSIGNDSNFQVFPSSEGIGSRSKKLNEANAFLSAPNSASVIGSNTTTSGASSLTNSRASSPLPFAAANTSVATPGKPAEISKSYSFVTSVPFVWTIGGPQPLAAGYIINTCSPSLQHSVSVNRTNTFKLALYSHTPCARNFHNNCDPGKVDDNNPFDSTSDFSCTLKKLAGQYSNLTYLTCRPSLSCDRTSFLPIHFAVLCRLTHLIEKAPDFKF